MKKKNLIKSIILFILKYFAPALLGYLEGDAKIFTDTLLSCI